MSQRHMVGACVQRKCHIAIWLATNSMHMTGFMVILQVVSLCLLVLASEHVRAMTCTRR